MNEIHISEILMAFSLGFLWAKTLTLPHWWQEGLRYLAMMLWIAGMLSVGWLYR